MAIHKKKHCSFMHDEPNARSDGLALPDVQLQSLEAKDLPRFLPVLSRYLAEIAPGLTLNATKKARRVLNRSDHRAFWFSVEKQVIGFAIILLLPEGQKELSDFTVFPKHRRHGIGSLSFKALTLAFPGQWRLGVSGCSAEANAFWGTCLSAAPFVHNIKTGAAFSSSQSKSFSFWVQSADQLDC